MLSHTPDLKSLSIPAVSENQLSPAISTNPELLPGGVTAHCTPDATWFSRRFIPLLFLRQGLLLSAEFWKTRLAAAVMFLSLPHTPRAEIRAMSPGALVSMRMLGITLDLGLHACEPPQSRFSCFYLHVC